MRKQIAALTIGIIAIGANLQTIYVKTRKCAHEPTRFNCVKFVRAHDGDTATFDIPKIPDLFGKGISVRFLGIDTPEMTSKDTCEKAIAKEAQSLVEGILKNAHRIDLVDAQKDKYFRILATVFADGVNLSHVMIDQGLAYSYDGKTKEKRAWCRLIK